MGVSGCGKSTVGQKLADSIGWSFRDGDSFHPRENIEKMGKGISLNDDDRFPWLQKIHDYAVQNPKTVIACSSLKRIYRNILSADLPVKFVLIRVEREELVRRMSTRPGHFMPVSLLDSQLSTIEYPSDEPNVIVVPVGDLTINQFVNQVRLLLKF